jgi:hypothetical protein
LDGLKGTTAKMAIVPFGSPMRRRGSVDLGLASCARALAERRHRLHDSSTLSIVKASTVAPPGFRRVFGRLLTIATEDICPADQESPAGRVA